MVVEDDWSIGEAVAVDVDDEDWCSPTDEEEVWRYAVGGHEDGQESILLYFSCSGKSIFVEEQVEMMNFSTYYFLREENNKKRM